MASIENVHVAKRSPEPLADLCGEGEMPRLLEAVERVRNKLGGGVIWNVNSTAHGGGVAELLHSLVAYARGAGVDCRWAVISGDPAFFVLTKHLHNALHGFGSASGFDAEARTLYERVAAENATELVAMMKPGDVAILHDPQTAGLAPLLSRHGVRIVWRCHIGSEEPSDCARAALAFLAPYLRSAQSCIFTRQAYVPEDWSPTASG